MLVLLVAAGCSSSDQKAGGGSSTLDAGTQLGCAVDLDHDGYGPGCPLGNDCNDRDPTIHQGCLACSQPEEGCPCEDGTPSVECLDHAEVYEDSMLCRAGRRYCRDGKWSDCAYVARFEVPVKRAPVSTGTGGIGQAQLALVNSDAGVECDLCSPECTRLTDPLIETDAALPDKSLTYTPSGSGITMVSHISGPQTVVTDNVTCKVPCAACTPTGPYDYNCDGNPDSVEMATCASGDTLCQSVRPFTTSSTGFSMQLGPGDTGTASFNAQFSSRTADVYFLFDSATVSSTLIDAFKNSLTTNPTNPGQPFWWDADPTLDSCATRSQGILGALQCLLNDPGVGIGFTREVPYEGPVNNISYGWDMIGGVSSDPTNPFSDFLFENLAPVNQLSGGTTAISAITGNLGRLIVRADPDATGPNSQIQSLWATASGQELFVGYDRPAIPSQLCSGTRFGWPCFRPGDSSVAVQPIVVLITGKPMYNGPTTDWQGNAITMPGSYPASYPPALFASKTHQGSYNGYIPTRRSLPSDYENFSTAQRMDLSQYPNTGVVVGDVKDDLATFTGDTSYMTADVDAAYFSCSGQVQVTGADAVHYFTLNAGTTGTTNVHIATTGTRFPSMLGLIKADLTTPPVLTSQNLTTYCCPDGNGGCLDPTLCGGSATNPYNVGQISPGTSAILQGSLTQAGSFPADLLECFSQSSAAQCGNTNKATDTAPNSVFHFTLSQDMALHLFSTAFTYDTNMALFLGAPNGVTDVVFNGTPPETYNVGTLNGHAWRFVGPTPPTNTDCNTFSLQGNTADYPADTFRTATDMAPADGVIDCGKAQNDPDIAFPFTISQDNTTIAFSTSGGQPELETKTANPTMVGVFRTGGQPPGAISMDATSDLVHDEWTTSAYDIPQADFTPPSITQDQYALVNDTATGRDVTFSDFTGLTNYYNAYRCNNDSYTVTKQLCTVPTTPTLASCASSQVSPAWMASTPDLFYKFTTTSTRSLKISAVGLDGAKHHLALYDAAMLNVLPPISGTSSTVDESAVGALTNLGSYTSLGAGETSSNTSTFALPAVSTYNQSFALPSSTSSSSSFALPPSNTSTTTFNLPAGSSNTSTFNLSPAASSGSMSFALAASSSTSTSFPLSSMTTSSGTFALPSASSASQSYNLAASTGTASSFALPTPSVSTQSFNLASSSAGSASFNLASSSSTSQSFTLAASFSGATTFNLASPSGSSQAFNLAAASSASTSFNVSSSSSTSSTFNLASSSTTASAAEGHPDTIATAYALGTLNGGDTITAASQSYLDNQNYGGSFTGSATKCIPLAGSLSSAIDEVYSFTSSVASTVTVTLKPNGTVSTANNKEYYPVFQVFTYPSSTLTATSLTCTVASTTAAGTLTSTAGTTYYVVVSRYRGGSTSTNYGGTYDLTVNQAPLAGGDTIASPLSLGSIAAGETRGVSGTGLTTNNQAITANYDSPTDYVSCNSGTPPDQVLSFVAGATTTATITATTGTFTSGNTAMVVYQDNGSGGLGTQLGTCSSAATATVTGTVTSGQTYYVLISGSAATAEGTYGLTVKLNPVAGGDTVSSPLALGTLALGEAVTVSGTALDTTNSGVFANYDSPTDYVSCNTGTPSDQVFSFVSPSAGSLTVTATASTFSGGNPAVVVYADNGSGGLGTQLGTCATGTTATVTGTTAASTTYYVVVSGSVTAAKGTYGLSVTLNSLASGDTVGSPIALGSVTGGQTLTVSGTGLTTNNSAINANYDSPTDYVSCNTGSPTDQVFSFTASQAAGLTVTATASSFSGGNPAVVVYADNGSGGLGGQLGTCSTGTTATVTGVTSAGTTYYVIVSGSVTAAKGTYGLSIALASPAGGDSTGGALSLGTLTLGEALAVSGTGLTTNNAVINPNYDSPTDYVSCNTGTPVDQVFSFVSPSAGALTVTATASTFSGGNPAIVVYQDNGSGGLGTQVGTCATGTTATVTGTTLAGTTYYVVVSGSVTAAKGTYGLTVTLDTQAPGDTVASPVALGGLAAGQTVTVSGSGLTTNNAAINPNYDSPTDYVSCNTGSPNDQVFSFTAGATAGLTITATASAFSGGTPAVVVYADNGSGGLGTQLGSCSTGATATVTGIATSGKTYYVIVSGSVGAAQGTYGLSIALDAPATGDTVASANALGTLTMGRVLTVSGTGLTTNNSLINANYDSPTDYVSCNTGTPPDQVFSFTSPATAGSLTVTATASTFSGGNPAMVIYADNGSGGLGAQLGTCATGASASITGTTAANTKYYVIVSGSVTAAKGTYGLTVGIDSLAAGNTVASPLALGSITAGQTVTVNGSGLTTNNTAITANYDSPTDYVSCNTSTNTPPDQVFSFSAGSNANATITVTASAFSGGNPAVVVYADNGSGGLGTQLGTCATGTTATVTGAVASGKTYYVVVSGSVTSAKGTYGMTVALDSNAGGDTVASPLSLGSIALGETRTVSGTGVTTNNGSITPNYDSPTDYVSCNTGTPADQVISFTSTSAASMTVTATSSSFTGGTPAVVVYADNGSGGLGTQVGTCATGATASVRGVTTAGKKYYVIVSGSATAAKGDYGVTVTLDTVASGDTIGSPIALGSVANGQTITVGGTGLTTFNQGITPNYDSPTDYVSCNTAANTPADQVFSFVPAVSAKVTVTATANTFTGGNPALVVYQDNGSGGLGTQLGTCSTGTTATVSGLVTAGKTYYAIVSGSVTAAAGTFGVTVAMDQAAGGDTVSNALSLGTLALGTQLNVSGSALDTSNSGVFANYDSPTDYVACNTSANTPADQVFKLIAGASGSLAVTATANSFSSGNPAVVVYQDNGSGGLGTQVSNCSTGTTAAVDGSVTNGTTYYIVVSGSVTAAKGTYGLSVTLDSKASGDTAGTALALGNIAAGQTVTASGSGLTTFNSGITGNYDSPTDYISCNTGAPADQVLSFTAGATTGVTVTVTANSFSGGTPAVAVYSSAVTQLGSCAVGSTATVSGLVTSGTTYYVIVSGSADAAKGSYGVTVSMAAPAGGDTISSPLSLGTLTLGQTLTVSGTGLTTNNPVINANYDSPTDYVSCNAAGSTPADQVISFTAPSAGSLTVTATAGTFSGGNPALVVWADNGAGLLGSQLGSCSTGSTATVTGTTTAGTKYYAIVSGSVTAAQGTYGLTVAYAPLAGGDTVSSPLALGNIQADETRTVNGTSLTTNNTGIKSNYTLSCGVAGSPDQVISFKPNVSASLTVTGSTGTFSSGTPVIALYPDNGSGGLGTAVGCSAGASPSVSGVVTAGQTYYVIVSGSTATSVGTYGLTVALGSAAPGDTVSSPLDLGSIASASTINVSGTGLTTNNTGITSNYSGSVSCAGASAPDQVLTFQATETATLTATATVATWPSGTPALAVFADNGSGGLGTQVGSCSAASTASVTGTVTAGTKYYIVVSGSSSTAKGTYSMVVTLAPRASGDTTSSPLSLGSLASATTLNVSGTGLTTNNAAINADYNATMGSCVNSTAPDQVLSFTATESTTLTVTATASSWSSGTAAVAVYTASGSSLGTQIGSCSNTSPASVTGTVTAGNTYYIVVGGSTSGAKGQYSLVVALSARASGDTISNALALGSIASAQTVNVSGTGLTTDNGGINADYNNKLNCASSSAPDQVFSFTATEVAALTVTVTSTSWTTGTPAIAVFPDNGAGGLGPRLGSCSAAATATVTGTTTANTLYYVVVSGSANAAKGPYSLSVALAPRAGGDTIASPLALGTVASGETRTVSGTGLDTSNAGITANYHSPTDYVSCNGAANAPDQVFSFTAGATTTATIKVTATTFSGGNPAVVVYADNGSGGLGTQVGSCATSSTISTVTGSVTYGTTYYVIVTGSATAAMGTYGLSVQLNSGMFDIVADAGSFPLGTYGAYVTNTTAAVSGRSTTYNGYVTCNSGANANDQVYKVTGADITRDLSFKLTPTGFTGALAVFSDGGGTLGGALGCNVGSTSGGSVELSVQPTTTTVYVVVSGASSGQTGTYTLQGSFGLHDTLGGAHNLGTIDNSVYTVANNTSKTGLASDYASLVTCKKNNNTPIDQVYKFHVGTASNTLVQMVFTPTTSWAGVVQLVSSSGGTLASVSNECSASSSASTTAQTLTYQPTTDNSDFYVIVTGYTTSSVGPYTLTVQDIITGNLGCASSTAPTRAVVTVKDLPAGTYYVALKVDDSGVLVTAPDIGAYQLLIEDASWDKTYGSTFCELNNYVPFEANYANGTGVTKLNRDWLEMTLDKGDYVAVLKGTEDQIKFIMRDTAYQPDVFGCHNTALNGYTAGATNYFDFGPQASSVVNQGLLPACVQGYSPALDPANGCKDTNGIAHYQDYYLVMRADTTTSLTSDPCTSATPPSTCNQPCTSNADCTSPLICGSTNTCVANPYTVYIQDGTIPPPVSSCSNTAIPDSYDGPLDNGNYYLVVKGIGTNDKGWYQVTVGVPGATSTEWSDTTFTPKTYAETVDQLHYPGGMGAGRPPIHVIGIQDGTDATTKKQLERLAYDTSTVAITNTPLVTQIDDTTANSKTVFSTSNIGYGITRSIQELAQSLVMDVTAVLDPAPAYANPGFQVEIDATGTAPACMGGISTDGKTWQDCHMTAMPNFNITVQNPVSPNNVPYKAGGYDMLVDLMGKVQIGVDASNNPIYRTYIVYQLPLHVDALANPTGAGQGTSYDPSATYTQTFTANKCLAVEAPDWSRLSFDATIPGDSSLEFKICTATDLASLSSCTPKRAALVTSGAACTNDGQCPGGFCSASQVCWYTTGPTCATDTDCGQNGTCVLSGTVGNCSWAGLPLDVGPALNPGGNGKSYARLDVVLNSSSNHTLAPTLNKWDLEYDCVGSE